MTKTGRPLLVLLSALRLVAAGCGGSDDAGGGAASTGRTITISNLEFAPETINAKVGDTITVENKDQVEHTLTAVDKSFDTGIFGTGNKTFTVTKTGRFEYMCEVHPFMAHRFIQVA